MLKPGSDHSVQWRLVAADPTQTRSCKHTLFHTHLVVIHPREIQTMQKRPSQPIRYETYCLFCGKTWSVQLGSPQLSCTCGANINCLRDLTTKAAQDLEEKVLGVLMDTWQEKMGEPRKRQLQSPVVPTRTKVVASSAPVIEEPLTPATRKQCLIVECMNCFTNVIVPDVQVFQCGSCDQYMTVEPAPPPANLEGSDLAALSNLSSSSASTSVTATQ